MAALRSRYGHYIFVLFLLFFLRLISAVADCMSVILPHNGVALVKIYDAGLKRAAFGSLKYTTQK